VIYLKEGFDSKTRKRIEDGIMKIEEAIRNNETKNSLESVIESYSKMDRISLIGKQTYLAESLNKLCGLSGTELILNLLTRGSSIGSFNLIDQIENSEVKAFLKRLVFKYGAQYQWFLEPFQKDWERYNLSTTYVGFPTTPVINFKIVNKSGQLLELESPLSTYSKLVVVQVQHLKTIDEHMKKMGDPKGLQKIIKKDLIKIKEIIEKLLEEDVKKN
jgi:hypothetical protein